MVKGILVVRWLVFCLPALVWSSGLPLAEKLRGRTQEQRPAQLVKQPETERLDPLSFRDVRITGPADVAKLRSRFGEKGMSVLLKINRIDARHLRVGRVLSVPETIGDVMLYCPFPSEIGELAEVPKTVLVSLEKQAFGAYQAGKIERWGPICTGDMRHPTPPGLYFSSWRSPRKVSSLNPTWIMPWYVNLHTSMGVAFHQYEMPGKPSSHGCIRLLKDDALWLYRWLDPWVANSDRITPLVYGTPVVVFGRYRFGLQPPWRDLPRNSRATVVSPDQIGQVLTPYKNVMVERSLARRQYFDLKKRTGPQGLVLGQEGRAAAAAAD